MQDGKPNPFLGLKPYGQKDRQKLYGRDKDLVLMKDRIFSARTTLLFAGSGVGKTSFLNAKIVPDLKRQYCVVYHNQWATDEPLVALSKSLATHFALNDTSRTPLPEPSTSKPLLEQLAGPVAPEAWRGALPITYHLGPGPAVAHLKLDFDNYFASVFCLGAR